MLAQPMRMLSPYLCAMPNTVASARGTFESAANCCAAVGPDGTCTNLHSVAICRGGEGRSIPSGLPSFYEEGLIKSREKQQRKNARVRR